MKTKVTAVVTGGAGFIGSHMVDILLENNFKVIVIDNFTGGHEKNLNHHSNNNLLSIENKDICDINIKKSIFSDAKYIFHFAGIGDIVPSIERPIEYLNTNVQGTVNILELSRNGNISKFVYAASSSCYGLASTPTSESHQISPLYPYALSKYQGEQCCLHWNNIYKLPVNSMRIFNAYGTRVRTTGAYGAVFGVFLKQKIENQPLTVVGDGNQKRDFLYVTDVAKGFLASAQSEKKGEIYNIGAGNPQTINKLTKLIGGKVEYLPKRPGEPDCTWADITKIKKDLNWSPKISFEEGVNKMIDDIQSWKDAPLWNKKNIDIATKTWFKYMSNK